MNRILVIIVTYNGMKWMDRCFGSLYASSEPVDIYVVDNCSVDGTPEYLRRLFVQGPSMIDETLSASRSSFVEFIQSPDNLGFGKANNLGFRYALEKGYDYIYLLNEDAWVREDCMSRLISASREDESLGILSPMQMADGYQRLDPRFEKKVSRCLSDAGVDIRSAGERSGQEIVEVPFFMAAHWFITRKCLMATGAFSPAFAHYGEDDNYIHRAHYHGFRTAVVTSAMAVHDRELRPETKEFRMKLKSVASVVKISSPLNCLPWRLFVQPLELIAISVIYLSWRSFKDAFALLGRYPELISLRKESKKTSAFL